MVNDSIGVESQGIELTFYRVSIQNLHRTDQSANAISVFHALTQRANDFREYLALCSQ